MKQKIVSYLIDMILDSKIYLNMTILINLK